MEAILTESLSPRRFNMLLFTSFAGLALLLAAVGIYSVLAYGVRSRLHEISIRMAVGAQVSDIVRLVILEGLRPAALGAAIGIFGAYLGAELLSKLTYGVSTADPLTFGAVLLLLASAAFLACVVPAYRATRVEPLNALRSE